MRALTVATTAAVHGSLTPADLDRRRATLAPLPRACWNCGHPTQLRCCEFGRDR